MPSNRNKVKEFHQLLKSLHKKTHGQAKIYDYNPDNIESFIVEIQPKKGLYNGGKFLFQINLGAYYPREPPDVICMTDIYHPNIDTDNFESHNICLNLFDEWNRSFGLEDVIQGIIFLFYYPNLRDPISHLFSLSLTQEEYEQNVTKSLQGGSIDGYPFQRNPGIDASVNATDEDPGDISDSKVETHNTDGNEVTQIGESNQNNDASSNSHDYNLKLDDESQPQQTGYSVDKFTDLFLKRTVENFTDPTNFDECNEAPSDTVEPCDASGGLSESQEVNTVLEEEVFKADFLFNDIEMSLSEDYNESTCMLDVADDTHHGSDSVVYLDLDPDTEKEDEFDLVSEDDEVEGGKSLKPDRSNELCHKALVGRYSCSCSSDSSFSTDTEDDDSHYTAESTEDYNEDQNFLQHHDIKVNAYIDNDKLQIQPFDEYASTFTVPSLLLHSNIIDKPNPVQFTTFIVPLRTFSRTRPLLLNPISLEDDYTDGICLSWRLHPQLYCLTSAYKCWNNLINRYFNIYSSGSGPLDRLSRSEVILRPDLPLITVGGVLRWAINYYLKHFLPCKANLGVNLVFVPDADYSRDDSLQ